MRKKKILEQNMLLFKQLGDAKAEIEKLKTELKNNTEILQKMREKNEEEKKSSPPLKQLEKKIQKNASLQPDLQFASETIGQIVIESARYSNMLVADGETKYKELVNLILGRAEVAKSEILAITKKEIPLNQKQDEITAVKDSAIEYFGNVMAQKI